MGLQKTIILLCFMEYYQYRASVISVWRGVYLSAWVWPKTTCWYLCFVILWRLLGLYHGVNVLWQFFLAVFRNLFRSIYVPLPIFPIKSNKVVTGHFAHALGDRSTQQDQTSVSPACRVVYGKCLSGHVRLRVREWREMASCVRCRAMVSKLNILGVYNFFSYNRF
jgi:hypothetical protein